MTSNYVPKPGDAVFAHTRNAYGALIRFGQALRWWKYRSWNHMALVDSVDPDGTVWVIQMSKHCVRIKLDEVAPGGLLKVIPAPEEINMAMALTWARKQLGTEYGVLTIVSIAINLLLPNPIRFDVRTADTLICSALVARAWEHGGWDCPTDPFQISPAEFDGVLGGGGFPIN